MYEPYSPYLAQQIQSEWRQVLGRRQLVCSCFVSGIGGATEMDPTDRAYLAKLVAADTGTAAPDAERRVDEVAARAKQDISRARSSAVILAFMAGAAALLGAIAAWAAAVTAGRYRDGQEAIPALWDWGSESRSLFSKNTR
jgi:predicted transcriptional regulator